MKNRLSLMEIEEIQNRTRAMGEAERSVVLANLSTTELQGELDRRLIAANKKVDMIYNVIQNNQELNTLIELQTFIKELKDCLL